MADDVQDRAAESGRTRVAASAVMAARAVALFVGAFGTANVVAGWVEPSLDANLWWVDLRALPAWLAQALTLAGALALLGYGLRPEQGKRLRWFAIPLVLGALWNSAVFWRLLAEGRVRSGAPLPMSLLVAGALGFVVWAAGRRPAKPRGGRLPRAAALLALTAVVALGFTVAQMICFGKTDYRRAADAVVVFGAGVRPGGAPSMALADRVRTAVGLYRAGLARKLIFSGGPGPGDVHETEAMRRLAEEAGVAPADILTDRAGLNTRATVRNTLPLLRRLGARRTLAVSHFYHLPRVKLAYRHEGVEVFTVPAEESRTLALLPYYMAREVAALWTYYLGIV